MLDYLDLGGTIRSVPAKESLQQVLKLTDQVGVTRIADITGLDNLGIPVVTVIRPFAKHLSVSQGKGLTLELATMSALMEAIECYHAEHIKTHDFEGTYASLSKEYDLIHPAQFHKHFLKQGHIEHISLKWIQAFELIKERICYIPYALINLDSSVFRDDFAKFKISTNGLAAGNTKDEALCHAIYEIIERDALECWSRKTETEIYSTQINIASIKNYKLKDLIEHLRACNLEIYLWDISSKLNVPAFNCILYNKNLLDPLRLFSGSGAHLSQEVALFRAILEAIQSRTSLISGNRDDIYKDYYYAQRERELNIAPRENSSYKDLAQCPSPLFENSFTDNVKQLKQILEMNGYHSIIVFDHTQELLGIPVVQAFIPGMQFGGRRM